MAAAARAPGPADARIPCPLCGGLIHPIAGRCKHCKGDLSALRSARPAAAATLPALASAQHPYVSPAPAAPVSAYAPPVAPTTTAPAAQVGAVGPALAYRTIAPRADESQPILPPRQTGRMPALAPRASWKSWPVIVIAIAVVAIVTAVVLMVWPPGAPTKANAGTLAPPPAPERMDTNPLPSQGGAPQGSLDPWNDRNGAAPDPAPTRPTPPSTTPDIDDIVPDPSSPPDPLAGPPGKNPMDLVGAIMDRACTRLASCPSFSTTMRATCELMKQVYPAQPPTCAAAQRCLARFDAVLTCDGDLDAVAVFGMLNGMDDCTEALSC